MKIALGLSIAVLVLALVPAQVHAAASGTAWGYQTGTVSCATFNSATTPEHRCFLSLAYPGNPLTVITCRPPYDTWCGAIVDGKTVILSFDDRSVPYNNGDTTETGKVPNGTTLTVY